MSTGHVCSCDYGYEGDLCGTAIPVINCPDCVHGECKNMGTFAFCNCYNGFFGLLCEKRNSQRNCYKILA